VSWYPPHQRRAFVLPLLRVRRTGARPLAVVFLAALVALVLPWSTQRADAFQPPLPSVLTRFLYGTGAYSRPVGVAVGDGLEVVATGVGAYQGTCYVLGAVAHVAGLDANCDAPGALTSIYNLLTSGSFYGTFPAYVGPATIVTPGAGWSPTSTEADVRFFETTDDPAYINRKLVASFLNRTTGAVYTFTSSQELFSCNRLSKAMIAPNANSPKSFVDAWNSGTTTGFCTMPTTGIPSTGYTLVSAGICNSVNTTTGALAACTTQWTTGYGAAAPVTATFTETCQAPGGGTFTRSQSSTYTPVPGGKSPDVALPNCWDITPGSVRTQVGVGVTRGGSTIETGTVPTIDPGIATKYPDCASSECLLTPQYVPTSTKCFSGLTAVPDGDCVDYWPSESTNPAAWRCFWGSYRVPLSFCEDAYPKKFFATGTRTNTGTDPTTDPTTAPAPADPPPCFISTCSNPPIPAVPPGGDPKNGGDSCMSDAVSFNPVKWVYIPVKCALIWAFVPDSGSISGVIASVKSAWLSSTPGLWVGAIGDLVPTGTLAGCEGPPFNLDFQGVHVHTHPFTACTGAGATAAGFVNLALSAGIVVVGGFACVRALGSGFGWRPGNSGADA
jgi:hypothetical protein